MLFVFGDIFVVVVILQRAIFTNILARYKNTFHDMINCNVAAFKQFEVFCMGARCSSVVRAFAHGAIGRRIDPL